MLSQKLGRLPPLDLGMSEKGPTDQARKEFSGQILKETFRAWLFESGTQKFWLPKSKCVWNPETKTMTIPLWIIRERMDREAYQSINYYAICKQSIIILHKNLYPFSLTRPSIPSILPNDTVKQLSLEITLPKNIQSMQFEPYIELAMKKLASTIKEATNSVFCSYPVERGENSYEISCEADYAGLHLRLDIFDDLVLDVLRLRFSMLIEPAQTLAISVGVPKPPTPAPPPRRFRRLDLSAAKQTTEDN